jgi:predicted membrane channel-forming protein YqfA (hemolysin III family)
MISIAEYAFCMIASHRGASLSFVFFLERGCSFGCLFGSALRPMKTMTVTVTVAGLVVMVVSFVSFRFVALTHSLTLTSVRSFVRAFVRALPDASLRQRRRSMRSMRAAP